MNNLLLFINMCTDRSLWQEGHDMWSEQWYTVNKVVLLQYSERLSMTQFQEKIVFRASIHTWTSNIIKSIKGTARKLLTSKFCLNFISNQKDIASCLYMIKRMIKKQISLKILGYILNHANTTDNPQVYAIKYYFNPFVAVFKLPTFVCVCEICCKQIASCRFSFQGVN